MNLWDLVRFVSGALFGHRLRSFLSALGVAIGVAGVILLTSLGQGVREYIVAQFTQFGTSLIAVNPGKVKTFGMPGVFGGTTRQLTLEDAESLKKVSNVEGVVPVVFGQARVSFGKRGRSVFIYGTSHDASRVWRFPVAQGNFLPEMETNRRGSFCVLGPKLAREIMPGESPLGKRVRIAGQGFVVMGIMEKKGRFLTFDLDDSAYIPVANAMDLFNVTELNEIDVLASSTDAVPYVADGLKSLLMARHRGNEDFTITTQTQMMDTFGKIIGIITMAVSAIAGISLFVGAIGILTIMWISVNERSGEIGLLRALGLTHGEVELLFLLEAAVLALMGGIAGLAVGIGTGVLLRLVVPGFPLSPRLDAAVAAILMSVIVGFLSGWLPARRAARLDPVEALRAE